MTRRTATDQPAKTHRGHNEGSITERKNSSGEVTSYQAQVTVPGGRRSQSFKTRAEARRWLIQARAEAAQGRLNPRRPPTLAEYLTETWLPAIEDKVKSRTHISYTLNAKRVPEWLGAIRLDELKPAHFQRFYTELSKARKAPRTVRQVAGIPIYARMAWGATLKVREQEYVAAARAMGRGTLPILLRHVLPNILDPLIVQATLSLGGSILAASALSYLGIGTQPPTADWGTLLSSGYEHMLQAWSEIAFPGLAVCLAVLSINLFGDGLADALNPRL
jgi:hypothetical protein